MMEEQRIRELLEKYGVGAEAIENFMAELLDVKEELEEDKQDQKLENQEPIDTKKEVEEKDENEDYLFNQKNMEILKATNEGKRLIINAPRMAKDELEREIKKLLG